MHRRKDEVRSSPLAGFAKAVGNAAIGPNRETLEREGRARAVATEAFERRAIAGAEGDPGVEVEALHFGAPRALAPRAKAFVIVGRLERLAVFVES